jgi:hypothetical protein
MKAGVWTVPREVSKCPALARAQDESEINREKGYDMVVTNLWELSCDYHGNTPGSGRVSRRWKLFGEWLKTAAIVDFST